MNNAFSPHMHAKPFFLQNATISIHANKPPPTNTKNPMLRSRIVTDRRKLRSLFANIQRLQSERGVVRELPVPGGSKAPPQQWNSTDEIPVSRDDAEVRIFDTVEPPSRPALPGVVDGGGPVKRQGLVRRVGAELGRMVVPFTGGLSDEEAFLLKKLTGAMVSFTPSDKAAVEAIARLRKLEAHPRLLRLLTPYAWKSLWALETETIPSVRSRVIGDMMVLGGVRMDAETEIKYIGGLFWNGAREEAVRRWEDLVQRAPTKEVYNLRVRLYALMQEPAKAEEIVERMREVLGTVEHKAWIPVIMAWNHVYEAEKAWKAYERMRECAEGNGERVTAKQFDDLAMSFLDSYQPAMGLQVYKHMVFAGHSALDRQQTETHSNLSEAVKAAQAETVDPGQLSALSVDALKNLPARVADKYFYGGWMLNLIRMNRADLAWHLITDVMPSQQFLPDSIHCNWAIQAFLQQGKPEMATSIAAQMITERIDQIATSKPPKLAVTSTRSPRGTPQETGPQIPPATIQTFSILVHYHARRQQMSHIITLFDQMTTCAISPNSYILNHLLHALLRTHEMTRLALTFDSMLRTSRVTPDFASFSLMWTAMWRHYTQTHRKTHDFLTPRELFALTVEKLPERGEEEEGKMKDIWYAIIKSFLLARDLEGTLVALHAGAMLWSMPVDETVVQEVAFGVLRARSWDPKITGGRPRIVAGTVVTSVGRLRELGRQIVAQRGAGGRPPAAARKRVLRIEGEDGSLESLTVLLKRELGDSVLVHDDVQRAMVDMGVGGVGMESLWLGLEKQS